MFSVKLTVNLFRRPDYLEKVKRLVGNALNTVVEARPAKIVAGMEPENTNRLLQLLAVAATHCPDSTKAVAMVKGELGSGAGQPAAAAKDGLPASQAKETEVPASSSAGPSRDIAATAESTEPPFVAQAKQENMGAPSSSTFGAKGDDDKPFSSAGGANGGAAGTGGGGDTELDLATDGDEEHKRSMRPTTARRRPPKVKDNVRQLEQAGVGGSANIAGTAMANKSHIKKEGEGDSDSDEEEKKDNDELGGGGVVADKAEGKSKLVQDIERENFAAGDGAKGEEESKEDGKKGIRLGSLKKSGTAAKKNSSNWTEQDVETLRVSVQKLCQSTNPLGKCMDFVNEDLNAMNKEHERWQQEYREKLDQLEHEQKKSAEVTHPLTLQLLDLDEQVRRNDSFLNLNKANKFFFV